MSRLSKVNKNGSLSIILPKAVTKDIWKEGDEVNVMGIGDNSILIDKQDKSCDELNEVFKDIVEGIDYYKELKDTNKLMLTEDMLRTIIKQFLLQNIRRI